MTDQNEWIPAQYGLLELTGSDDQKMFFIVNLNRVFDNKEEAQAELDRLNKKEQSNATPHNKHNPA